MKYNFFFFLLALSFLLNACSESGKKTSSLPSDLNFNEVRSAEAFTKLCLHALISQRSSVLSTQFISNKLINDLELRKTTKAYNHALKNKEWITAHKDIVEDDHSFSKSYVWLDKKRRLGMTITFAGTKDYGYKLNSLTFESKMSGIADAKF